MNNGVTIPQLGFGVFQVPPEETRVAVGRPWRPATGTSTRPRRTATRPAWAQPLPQSGLAREDIFITTKLRNGEQGSPRAAFEASRKALGVDWVDLYLIHWPVPSQGLFTQAWKELESLYAQGLIRAIGVSNFLPEHLDELLAGSTVVPAVNQIEAHPTFQQAALAQKSRGHGIAVEAYSPLGQGQDLENDVVAELAAKYGATPAQMVLAWHLGLGNIVIPKTVSPERMARKPGRGTDPAQRRGPGGRSPRLESGTRIGADPAVAAFTQL